MAKVPKKFTNKEDIPEGLEQYYHEVDGEWVLEGVDGEEDIGALKRAKQHEKTQRQAAEQKARELQAQIDELQEQIDSGDKSAETARLQRQLETANRKLTETTKQLGETETQWKARFEKKFVDSAAMDLARDLSDTPGLILPHIRSRLVMDFDGEEPTLRVKGEDGQVSDLSLEAFKKSINDNVDYAPALRGSGASGGGADPSKKGPGAQGTKGQKPDFLTASAKEIAAWVEQNQTEE